MYNWRKTQRNPFPDLGVTKVCRDFDAVMKWQEEAELKNAGVLWDRIVRPVDATELPMPERLDELNVTGYAEDGLMLSKITDITKPDECM